jgi:hypothetical protein
MIHVLLVLGLTASGSSVDAQLSLHEAGPANQGLRLAFQISQEQAPAGNRYRIKTALFNETARPVSFYTIRHQPFDPADARLVQIGAYLAAQPEIRLCDLRQVGVGHKSKVEKLVKTLKPGATLIEEWITDGININFASFDGTFHDGGGCLEQRGTLRVKVFLRLLPFNNPGPENFTVESNEQVLSLQ